MKKVRNVREWVHLTQAGVPVACMVEEGEYRCRVPETSRAVVFLPSEFLETGPAFSDRCVFDASIERTGRRVVEILEGRIRNLEGEMPVLGKLKRDVAVAGSDHIRASLLDDYLRKSDPERISKAEAERLVERRMREARKDLGLMQELLDVYRETSELSTGGIVVGLRDRPSVVIDSPVLENALSIAVGECLLEGRTDMDEIRASIVLRDLQGSCMDGSDAELDDVFEAIRTSDEPVPSVRAP